MVISGESIQSRCALGTSKQEHVPFEGKCKSYIDIDNFPEIGVDNPPVVYANSSLINKHKPALIESKFLGKLKHFLNPFNLILHNSDQEFNSSHLDLLEIPNLNKVFSRNVNIVHDRVIPLPIGVANNCWKYGDSSIIEDLVPKENKTKELYFNFTVEGGVRDVKRPGCYKALTELGVEWLEEVPFGQYIEQLNDYKLIASPEGNGIDCHRTWEALYTKTVPIVDRNVTTEFYSKLFPIYIVDDWAEFNIEDALDFYDNADWSNYELLELDALLNYLEYDRI